MGRCWRDYVLKAGATAPAAPEDPTKVLGGPPSDWEEREWQVQVRREGRPAVVIRELTQKTYDNEAAGTEVGGIFWVTDGTQLFRIDADGRVTATKILGMTPASRPAAR